MCALSTNHALRSEKHDTAAPRFSKARAWFVDNAHIYAAGGNVHVHHRRRRCQRVLASKHKQRDPNARNRYLSIAILMPVIVVGLLAFGGNYHVLAAEFAAIFLFAVFWAFQTEELWDEGVRREGIVE